MRQYIGARYVPKFMGTYDATQSYEALCVVDNGLGTSYISKVPTPANTPLTDTTYWAIYGASSGAIVNLQNQIDDMNDGSVPGSLQNQINNMNDGSVSGSLQNQINLLATKKYVLITDSYGTVQSNAFPLGLCAKLGKTLNTDFFYSASSGSGFVNGTTFLAQLQALESNYNKDEITDIIVVGGVNDGSEVYATEYAAITSFYNYVAANYPNAHIYIGFISRSTDTGAIYNMYINILRAYKLAAISAPKMSYITDCETWLSYGDIDSDMIHPTASGCNYLAWTLGSYLINGYSEFRFIGNNTYPFTFDAPDVTSYGSTNLIISHMNDNRYEVRSGQILCVLANGVGNTFANGKKIASCAQPFINAVDYTTGSVKCIVSLRVNNGTPVWYDVEGRLMIRLDGIYLKCLAPYGLVSETVDQFAIWQGIKDTLNPIEC